MPDAPGAGRPTIRARLLAVAYEALTAAGGDVRGEFRVVVETVDGRDRITLQSKPGELPPPAGPPADNPTP